MRQTTIKNMLRMLHLTPRIRNRFFYLPKPCFLAIFWKRAKRFFMIVFTQNNNRKWLNSFTPNWTVSLSQKSATSWFLAVLWETGWIDFHTIHRIFQIPNTEQAGIVFNHLETCNFLFPDSNHFCNITKIEGIFVKLAGCPKYDTRNNLLLQSVSHLTPGLRPSNKVQCGLRSWSPSCLRIFSFNGLLVCFLSANILV